MAFYRNLITYFFLIVILALVCIGGGKAITNEKRLTIDGSLYDSLGAQLAREPLNYSPRSFWARTRVTLKDGKAKEIARGYLDQPLFKHPPLFAYMIAVSKSLFGQNYDASKYVPLVLRALTVLCVFALARKLLGSYYGLLAAFLAAIDPVYMFSSQKVWTEVPYSFFVYLSVCLLLLAEGKQSRIYLSAVSLGLALLCKYVAVLGVIPVYCFFVFSGYGKKKGIVFLYSILLFIVFLPWLLWNYNAFGPGFLYRMISLHTSDISGVSLGFTLVPILSTVAVFALLAGLLFLLSAVKAWGGGLIVRAKNVIEPRTLRIVLTIIMAELLFVLIFLSKGAVINGLNIAYLPPTSDSMHFFDKKPVYFYLSHLLELSPLYLLSYVSALLIAKWDVRMACIALIPVSVLAMFTYYGRFETRYIAMATPALMILAAYSIREIICFLMRSRGRARILWVSIFSCIICYMIARTVHVDMALVMKNNFIYF